MDIKNLTPDERFELVMECRRSGLTDHQWLKKNKKNRGQARLEHLITPQVSNCKGFAKTSYG